MNKLRLVAPTNVLDAASRVATALTTTALYATDPLARLPGRPLARSWANFTNVFRAEVGNDQYTDLSLPVVPQRLGEASGAHRVPGLFHEIIGLLLEDDRVEAVTK